VRDDGGGAAVIMSSGPRRGERTDRPRHGVGLLSTRRLIEEHGGCLRADHGEQGGMAFTIDVPVVGGSERVAIADREIAILAGRRRIDRDGVSADLRRRAIDQRPAERGLSRLRGRAPVPLRRGGRSTRSDAA
jgi:hypothetical protein